jgi:hypothetical protein
MASFKKQKDYTQLLKNLKARYNAGKMTKAEYDRASLNIRREKTAALRAGAEKARKAADSWISGGTFGKWLTTPASVSEILGGRNAKKTTVKTAASENIGAVSGAKPQKKKTTASTAASQESAQRGAVRSAAKTKATKEERKGPPQRAAKKVKKKVTPPKSKPKMYTAIDVNTGKPKFDAPKVTAAQRLKQENKFKALKAKRKAFSGKFKSITKGK